MALRVGNMARRVTIASSKGGAWGFEGYSIPDLRGGSSATTEGANYDDTELFAGIGIIARPTDADNAEAVILQVGAEAEHPTIIAVRNEAARARYEAEFGELEKGAVAVFNSAGMARALITADGDVHVTAAAGKKIYLSHGGSTERVALKSDVDGHTHGPGSFSNSGGSVVGVSGGAAAITGSESVEVE